MRDACNKSSPIGEVLTYLSWLQWVLNFGNEKFDKFLVAGFSIGSAYFRPQLLYRCPLGQNFISVRDYMNKGLIRTQVRVGPLLQ